MDKILIVEDSILYENLIKNRFKTETDYELVFVRSLKETVCLLDKSNDFFAAITEFKLQDAPNGEIIDLIVNKKIPIIVFTSDINKEIRDIVWSKSVFDYVLKIDPRNFEYILSLLNRLKKNPYIKVVVAEQDVSFSRKIVKLLKIHKFKVYTASDGLKAKELIMNKHPDTKILLTEFKIPKIDGFALTYFIREHYKKEDLAIIGITSVDDSILSTSFLKYGADDIITRKNFEPEEFYRHIILNIENIEHFEAMRKAAFYDYLTGLYNRRYFFEFGQKLVENSLRGNFTLTCAMLDLDKFKTVNDTYGHEAGDIVLKKFAEILIKRARKSDLVARIGGEEFCFLAINLKNEFAYKVFNDFKNLIENTSIDIGGGQKIKITVSIGVCNKLLPNLDDMIKKADIMLYKAKANGRNRVEIDQ